MKRTKEKRGITLIALIITIIVLLILAGVTISMVVGDNGVLKQAQNAKIKTEKAKDEELRGLTAAEAGGNLEMTWHTEKVEDGKEIKVPIPAGFAVSQVEGENKIDDGLVVIDKNGNEFVWIPCGKLDVTTGKYSTEEYEKSEDYVTQKNWSEHKYKDKIWTNQNKDIAKKSIENYGGFYVARFEAGVPSNAKFYVSSNESRNEGEYKGKDGISSISTTEDELTSTKYDRNDSSLKPVSKRYNQVWNFINQTTAKTVSKKMYEDNDTVNSYLISSNDWNYICGNILVEDVIKNSIKYGNYKNNTTTDYTSLNCLWAKHEYNSSDENKWKYATKYGKESITTDIVNGRNNANRIELATGASDDFKIYNIYDMAGNVWEWTEETATDDSKTYTTQRGGSFYYNSVSGVNNYGGSVAGTDSSYTLDDCLVDVGFRPVLYVK